MTTAKKVTINDAYTLLNVVTTGKTQTEDRTTDAPFHDESVIAVRDKLMNVSDEKVSAGQAQHDDTRSMTIKAYNKIEADLLDYQCVTLHVPSTPENKDSINEVCL